jgi:hypothetical protein
MKTIKRLFTRPRRWNEVLVDAEAWQVEVWKDIEAQASSNLN